MRPRSTEKYEREQLLRSFCKDWVDQIVNGKTLSISNLREQIDAEARIRPGLPKIERLITEEYRKRFDENPVFKNEGKDQNIRTVSRNENHRTSFYP